MGYATLEKVKDLLKVSTEEYSLGYRNPVRTIFCRRYS